MHRAHGERIPRGVRRPVRGPSGTARAFLHGMATPRTSVSTRLVLIIGALVIGSCVVAQRERKPLVWDTTFVRDYSQRPTVRIYASNKFNSLLLRALPGYEDLRYRPNGRLNLGIGVSYRRLTLNIGLPAPFVNNDNDARGRTRFIDAQANLYTVRQASNLFLQSYRGYHITSHDQAQLDWEQPTLYPYRADLRQFNIGLSSLRIHDHERFSYRAAFNQDAWQLRSAGSWLYGGYATCYVLKADSSIIPERIGKRFNASSAIRQGIIADIGPMAGYAFTHVYKRHWFITVSGAGGAGLCLQRLRVPTSEGEQRITDIGPGWHVQFRAAAGYNSARYYAGVLFNQELVGCFLRVQDRFAWDVGNFRVILAQRISQRPPGVDKGLRWLRSKDPTR